MSHEIHDFGRVKYIVGDVCGAETQWTASRGGMKASGSKLNAIFVLAAFLVRKKARFTIDYLVLRISSVVLISSACYLVFHFSLLHYSLPFVFLYSSVPSLLYSSLQKPSTFKFRSISPNYEDLRLIPHLCFAPFNSICSRYTLLSPSSTTI
jgi:hypothetical protein